MMTANPSGRAAPDRDPRRAPAEGAAAARERPSVAVVIPLYNRWDDTRLCLASLEAALAPGDTVILVDNCSSDGSAPRAAHWFETRGSRWSASGERDRLGWRIVVMPSNVGFGAACNAGFAAAPGFDFYWVLNNDTEVDAGALDALLAAAADRPDAGFVGSYVYVWPDVDRVWSNGAAIDLASGDAVHHVRVPSGTVHEVDYVSGCSMLVRRSTLDAVGVFNPAFFMYYEETELQVRARRQGHRVYVAEGSRVGHKVGTREGVSAMRGYHTMRGQVILLRLHGSRPLLAVARAVGSRVGRHLARGRLGAVRAALRGAVDGLRAPLRAGDGVGDSRR